MKDTLLICVTIFFLLSRIGQIWFFAKVFLKHKVSRQLWLTHFSFYQSSALINVRFFFVLPSPITLCVSCSVSRKWTADWIYYFFYYNTRRLFGNFFFFFLKNDIYWVNIRREIWIAHVTYHPNNNDCQSVIDQKINNVVQFHLAPFIDFFFIFISYYFLYRVLHLFIESITYLIEENMTLWSLLRKKNSKIVKSLFLIKF